jgi:hypothetical protein
MLGALIASAALLMQAAPPATPDPPAPAAAPTPTSAGRTVSPAVVTGKKSRAVDPQEVVCRTEPVMGTLFPRKICATRQQLNERTRVDQQQTREATNLRPYKITDGINP